LREQATVGEVAKRYQVHPTQVSTWKKQLIEQAAQVFQREGQPVEAVDVTELYAQIGKLQMQVEYLKKSCPSG
jgi:transposase